MPSLFLHYLTALSSPTATGQNIFLLTLTAILKITLTAWTFGMMVTLTFFSAHFPDKIPGSGRYFSSDYRDRCLSRSGYGSHHVG